MLLGVHRKPISACIEKRAGKHCNLGSLQDEKLFEIPSLSALQRLHLPRRHKQQDRSDNMVIQADTYAFYQLVLRKHACRSLLIL